MELRPTHNRALCYWAFIHSPICWLSNECVIHSTSWKRKGTGKIHTRVRVMGCHVVFCPGPQVSLQERKYLLGFYSMLKLNSRIYICILMRGEERHWELSTGAAHLFYCRQTFISWPDTCEPIASVSELFPSILNLIHASVSIIYCVTGMMVMMKGIKGKPP